MISHYRRFCEAAENLKEQDVDAAIELAGASFEIGHRLGLCFGFLLGAVAASAVWAACCL